MTPKHTALIVLVMFFLGSAYPLGKFGLNASMNPIFFGIIILQNGNKHKKTNPILNAPKKIGFIDAFNPNFPRGYALPRKNITKTIKAVCFGDKILSNWKGV